MVGKLIRVLTTSSQPGGLPTSCSAHSLQNYFVRSRFSSFLAVANGQDIFFFLFLFLFSRTWIVLQATDPFIAQKLLYFAIDGVSKRQGTLMSYDTFGVADR